MVISCDAKMIRPATQIDYVGGNERGAAGENAVRALDLLVKSMWKIFPVWDGGQN
jgi:hypothetical protein